MRATERPHLSPVDRPKRGWPRLVAALLVFVLGLATYSLVGCSNGNGLRKGSPDAGVDLFPPCQCATPDGADSMVVDSAVESDGATRMDTMPDGADSMVVDSAVEPDGDASIDTAGALSCYHSLDGLLGVIDSACQSDEDCTTILIGNKCIALCWLSINVANVAAVEAAEDQLCQPFLPQQCRLVQPPCPSVHAPSCVAGSCQTEYGFGPDAAAK